MPDLLRSTLHDPVLDAAQERVLATAARAGDESSREELVRRSLRLVALRVRSLGVRPPDADDAFQSGAAALVLAVDRFDPERGVRLATYAWPWITRAVLDVRRVDPRLVVVAEPADPAPGEPAASGVPDVAAAVAGLPEELEDVVRLRYGTGAGATRQLAWAEVADGLGTSIATARRRHDRAMTHLRRRLARVSPRAPHAGAGPP